METLRVRNIEHKCSKGKKDSERYLTKDWRGVGTFSGFFNVEVSKGDDAKILGNKKTHQTNHAL